MSEEQPRPLEADVTKLVNDIMAVCSGNRYSSIGRALQTVLSVVIAHDMARRGEEGRDRAIEVASAIAVTLPESVAAMLDNFSAVPRLVDPRDEPRAPVPPTRMELTNRIVSICAGADLNVVVDALLNAYVLRVAGAIHLGLIEEKDAAEVIAQSMQKVPDAVGDRLAKLRHARPQVLQ